jgi:hypothetical protein
VNKKVLHDFTAVLKDSAVKVETAKATITETSEKFREQRSREWKHSDNADKRTKKPATSAAEVNDSLMCSMDEVPTRNLFGPLRTVEMEADFGAHADVTTDGQQQQAPSSQAGRHDTIASATKGLT